MELSLPVIIGAAVGLGVGVLDYGIIAALLRRALAKGRPEPGGAGASNRRHDLLFKLLFVVNALAFAAVGALLGSQVAGYGL
jgi:hypothetical protein